MHIFPICLVESHQLDWIPNLLRLGLEPGVNEHGSNFIAEKLLVLWSASNRKDCQTLRLLNTLEYGSLSKVVQFSDMIASAQGPLVVMFTRNRFHTGTNPKSYSRFMWWEFRRWLHGARCLLRILLKWPNTYFRLVVVFCQPLVGNWSMLTAIRHRQLSDWAKVRLINPS